MSVVYDQLRQQREDFRPRGPRWLWQAGKWAVAVPLVISGVAALSLYGAWLLLKELAPTAASAERERPVGTSCGHSA